MRSILPECSLPPGTLEDVITEAEKFASERPQHNQAQNDGSLCDVILSTSGHTSVVHAVESRLALLQLNMETVGNGHWRVDPEVERQSSGQEARAPAHCRPCCEYAVERGQTIRQVWIISSLIS